MSQETESYRLEQGKTAGTPEPSEMDPAPLAPDGSTLAGPDENSAPDSAEADRLAAEERDRERGRGK